MNDTKILIGIGVATFVIVLGGIFLVSNKTSNTVADATPVPVSSERLVREDSNKIATESAKVTIVEFSDYQCPACAAAEPIVNQTMEIYKGKVNLVMRHFPLTSHKNAEVAALAAEAAGQQGKYWEMHKALFTKQSTWSESSDPVSEFAKFAVELKLDVEKFKKDIADKKGLEKINRDQEDGIILGVSATPTFFVNGVKLQGVPNLADFSSIIEENLSK